MDYSTDVEYETKEKKKFQITRGMVILAVLALIILIVIIIVIVKKVSSNNANKYSIEDFQKLEGRMIEEAPTYISQNQMVLTDKEVKIDLKDLLVENGGFIDPNKVKAAKVCDGYVLASKQDKENYSSYIKCGNMYTTKGYSSSLKDNKTTTTSSVADKINPTITLIGESEITISIGDTFNDPGAKAVDNIDGDITSKIKTNGSVDTKNVGTYIITYEVEDNAKNKSNIKRTVNVIARSTTAVTTTTKAIKTTKATTKKTNPPRQTTTARKPMASPVITLYGSKTVTINVGGRYTDPGYSAVDSLGKSITGLVKVSGNVNTTTPGTYYITYQVTDEYGNKASASRIIIVKSTSVALSGIQLSPNTLDMKPGQNSKLTVFFNPTNATDKTITWSSSNNSIATVSNGTVYAKSRGTAVITARASNGKTASARVTVK